MSIQGHEMSAYKLNPCEWWACLIIIAGVLVSNVIGATTISTGEPTRSKEIGHQNDPYRWDRYLTGTYWFVPPDALPAQFHRASSILPVEQQTVYYIENSKRGVITGWMVTQFTSQAGGLDFPISCQDMFGTIAPRGEISLTVVTPGTGGVAHPWPVSYMVKVQGRWLTMVLASTLIDNTSAFITHGPTYMTPISPRSLFWQDLPGSPGTVPDFVSLCGHQVITRQ